MAAAICAAALVFLACASRAQGATISVNTPLDNGTPGNCELREAIDAADADSPVDMCTAGSGPDRVNISVGGTITLQSGELQVDSVVGVFGLGAGSTTITQFPVSRIFHVGPTGVLGLTGLSVSGGVLANDGAGILNEGVLTLDDVTVTGNNAVGEDGGGIAGYAGSATTIEDSQIGPGNVAGAAGGDGDGFGGGIYLQGGELTLRRTLVYGNSALEDNSDFDTDGQGGGIFAWPWLSSVPSVTIESSTIGVLGDGNEADVSGGGVAIRDGPLTVRRSEVVDNEADGDGPGSGDGAGSGVFLVDTSASSNSHEISGSMISRNDGGTPHSQGGGLFSNVDGSNSLLLERTTFFENTAVAGGGALFYGDALIRNVTFSSNSAANFGSAIVANPPSTGTSGVEIVHSTLSQNETAAGAGALSPGVGADVTVRASVIENFDDSGECGPIEPIVSAGYNIVGDDSCALGASGDLASASAQLLTLDANGGPAVGVLSGNALLTYGLPPGSPAVDRAPCAGLTTDQRGFPRPSPSNGLCDTGAFERSQPEPPAGPGPPPAGAQPPSNAFGFGKLKRNKKKGIAFLFVNLPGPGDLSLAGKGLKPLPAASAGKSVAVARGQVKLVIRPGKGKAARKLARRLRAKGKAQVKARVTFVPTGGSANTKVRKLKLIRRR